MPRSKETPPSADTEPLILSPEEFSALYQSGRIVLVPKEESIETKPKRHGQEGGLSQAEALQIMGPELFRGPEQVEKVFGFRPDDLPIPFSKEELEKARELKQYLRQRVSATPDGKPLSVYAMGGILAPKFEAKEKGSIPIYEPTGWKKGEPCWQNETPRDGWALVSAETVPGTLGQNYLEQTDILIAQLKNEIYKGESLPQVYQDAIAQYDREKAELVALASSDWQKAALRLSELAITGLLRPTVSEICQDLFSEYILTGKRLYPSTYSQTGSLSHDGYLVHVGNFDARGVSGIRYLPLESNDLVGASFSRHSVRS